jgi:hypothetical protein
MKSGKKAPAGKPISLYPMTFEEAVDRLLATPPEAKKPKQTHIDKEGGAKRHSKRQPRKTTS